MVGGMILRLPRCTSGADLWEWHDWFAWRPVVAENEHGVAYYVWLETCRRQIAHTDFIITLLGRPITRNTYRYTFTERNT